MTEAGRHPDGAHGLTRRGLLLGGGAGLLALAGGAGAGRVLRGSPAGAAALRASAATNVVRLAASDGFISLPGKPQLYIFGFKPIPTTITSLSGIIAYAKGKVQSPAPILAVDEVPAADTTGGLRIELTNAGFLYRPDLDDSHTIHWHGFRNAIALFDGVPEVSIAVPPNRSFPYFYRPRDPGTYIYHCHFEDVEHVQMGMTGIVFVRPAGHAKWVYNDAATAFDREFALLLNEVWTEGHDNDLHIQESVWTDYDPDYWVINGRSYPDTLKLNNDTSLPNQPISSLVQVNPGDRVLLRLANLGYQQHALQLSGIAMKVVGEDATLLRGPGGADLSYSTNTVYIAPGESRDVLFTAPAFDGTQATGSDAVGAYNAYPLRNRNLQRLTNGGAPGLGGMATEVRVYQSPLPAQTTPNETYPA